MSRRDGASADDFEDVAETGPPPTEPAKNAFTEMMKPKPQPKADLPSKQTTFYGRDGLGIYTDHPEQFPQSRVIYYNDNFVVINDLFPKSVVHLLILPRNKEKNIMHPTDAFDDPDFLALCRTEEKKVRAIAASELQRQLSRYSAQERPRLSAMEADDEPSDGFVLPAGRDWDKEIMSGIHANPSMNHLHIHVLSKDLHSERMKKANHYLSFTTDFFARMQEFPLRQDDERRDYRHFQEDLMCWRCGRGFGRKFAKLKRHLEEEFEGWKME